MSRLAQATPRQLFDACVETADATLAAIFGDALIDDKYVEARADCRSLGCLVVDADAVAVSANFDKVSLIYDDDAGRRHYIKVTELAFAAQDEAAAAALRARIAGHDRIALRLGLARAWPGPNGEYDPRRCYLQLNGVVVPA